MSNKIEICLNFTLRNPFDDNKDPIHNLLSNFDEIKKISQNLNKDIRFKFIYFNKKKVHKILYEEEELYIINYNDKITFSELFYLSLLILDEEETINYTFSIEYIKSVNNIIKENREIKELKKILISKIVLILIHNFKGEDEYDEDIYGKEIEELENENKELINNNMRVFEDLNLKYNENDIYSKKLDYIYMEIITALIKTNNFNDDCMNIIEQLELDKIHITDTIFKGLSNLMDINNDYMQEYKINDIYDLKDEKKINFYYILIKYIFKKDSLYVYQNDFLLFNIKKIFILIKSKKTQIESLNIKKEIYDKIKEILHILPYCNIDKYINDINVNNINTGYSQSISNLCKNEREKYKFTGKTDNNSENLKVLSKQKDKNSIQNNNKNSISPKIIDVDKAEKILKKTKLTINIFLEENKVKLNYKEILYGDDDTKMENIEDLKINGDYDSMINVDIDKESTNNKNRKLEIIYKNYKRFANFIKDIEECIKNADIKFNPQITLELKREFRDINNEINSHNDYKDLYNITCTSTFYNQLEEDVMKFKDKNILVYSINGKNPGFIYLIDELTNDDYKGEIFTYNENEKEKKVDTKMNNNKEIDPINEEYFSDNEEYYNNY